MQAHTSEVGVGGASSRDGRLRHWHTRRGGERRWRRAGAAQTRDLEQWSNRALDSADDVLVAMETLLATLRALRGRAAAAGRGRHVLLGVLRQLLPGNGHHGGGGRRVQGSYRSLARNIVCVCFFS